MSTEIRVPKLGITEDDAVLVDWAKGEGDHVDEGEAVATLETDKATYDLESPAAGIVGQLLVTPGQMVQVGALLGLVVSQEEWDAGGGRLPHPAEPPAAADMATEGEPAAPDADASETPGDAPPPDPVPDTGGRIRATPRARRLAAERGIELRTIVGTGPDGTITHDDVLSAESGRAGSTSDAEAGQSAPTEPAPAIDAGDVLPLTRIQQITARRTAEAFAGIPHFWLTSDSDAEQLVGLVDSLNADPASANRVTITDVIIAVCARTLVKHPRVNAAWKSDQVVASAQVNIGLATAVTDGLLVPVLHDVAEASIRRISEVRSEIVERSRQGRARPDDLQGATFSISNLGMFGVDQAMGILNPPGCALLFVGTVTRKPVVVDDGIEARARITLTLAGDHRVLDGASGGAFLRDVRLGLENASEDSLA